MRGGNPLEQLLEMSEAQRARRGVAHTPTEIRGQVALWADTVRRIRAQGEEILSLIAAARRDAPLVVVLSGAGSSEFVGHCLEGLLRRRLDLPVQAVSSARIAATPREMFPAGCAVLLVSFARSGDSPESVGAVRLAEFVCRRVYHLAISCNEQGALARELGRPSYHGRAVRVFLDPATADRGLAMTSSFSNLVVAGQAVAHLAAGQGETFSRSLPALQRAGEAMLERAPEPVRLIARRRLRRAVFLGDGANLGTAMESHLKVQELSAGALMCAWDSFPGLRHGPQAVIDGQTLVVGFLASHPYTRAYELDLLRQLRAKRLGRLTLTVSAASDPEADRCADIALHCAAPPSELPDDLTPPAFVIVGQLLGLFTSLARGLRPDQPSTAGVIHRVVEGVRVFDLQRFERDGRLEVLAER